jgi:hypothetical protein
MIYENGGSVEWLVIKASFFEIQSLESGSLSQYTSGVASLSPGLVRESCSI